jgi:hypothetical protein
VFDDKCVFVNKQFHRVKEGRKPVCYAKDHQVDEGKEQDAW